MERNTIAFYNQIYVCPCDIGTEENKTFTDCQASKDDFKSPSFMFQWPFLLKHNQLIFDETDTRLWEEQRFQIWRRSGLLTVCYFSNLSVLRFRSMKLLSNPSQGLGLSPKFFKENTDSK